MLRRGRVESSPDPPPSGSSGRIDQDLGEWGMLFSELGMLVHALGLSREDGVNRGRHKPDLFVFEPDDPTLPHGAATTTAPSASLCTCRYASNAESALQTFGAVETIGSELYMKKQGAWLIFARRAPSTRPRRQRARSLARDPFAYPTQPAGYAQPTQRNGRLVGLRWCADSALLTHSATAAFFTSTEHTGVATYGPELLQGHAMPAHWRQ